MIRMLPLVLSCAACAATPAPPNAQRAGSSSTAERGVRGALLRALAEREARLAGDLSDDERAAIREERLAITVALTELDRGSDETKRDDKEVIAEASRRVREAKRRRSQEKQAKEEDRSRERADRRTGVPIDALERLKGSRKPWNRAPPVEDGRTQTACAPGDPLCGDGFLQPPPPPPPIESPKPIGGDDERPDDRSPPRAARVAPSQPPKGVDRMIERHAARLRSCLPPAKLDEGIHLEVHVRIDARGRIRDPRVIGSTLEPRVGACIGDVFRGMRVDGPAGSSRRLTIPLWLVDDR